MSAAGPAATVAAYAKQWMKPAKVWRKDATTDAGGGSVVDWVDQQRTVYLYLTAPSDTEAKVAEQTGVTITHTAVMQLDTDVSYGDRVELAGKTYQLQSDPLTATHGPLSRATVRKTPFNETTS